MKIRTGVCVALAAAALLLSSALLKNATAAGDATAEITAIENASVKADMAGDKAFYEKRWRTIGRAATARASGSPRPI